jgi:cobalt/nickel transport system permease protein
MDHTVFVWKNRHGLWRQYRLLPAACLMVAAWAPGAYAMHITEGILPLPWAIGWYAVTLPFLMLGVRELRRKGAENPLFKVLVGLIGAAVFVISCMPIPVPLTGTCSHPTGTGLAAILIGPFPTVIISSIALLFQALFLAHGGLTTLGANIVSMGIAGGFAGYGIFLLVRRLGGSLWLAAFFAGLCADWATYIATSFILAAGLDANNNFLSIFGTVLVAFVPTQLPLGILEGIISAGTVRFVASRRPELIGVLRRKLYA